MKAHPSALCLVALVVAASCVKKPATTRRPEVGKATTPRDGTLDQRPRDDQPVPVVTDAGPPSMDPSPQASAEPSAAPTGGVVASPAASPTGPGPQPSARPSSAPATRSLTVVTSFTPPGGWFRSCVAVRVKNADTSTGAGNAGWKFLGCTKPEPATASACVGADASFNGRLAALPLPAGGKAVVTVRVQTFRSAGACGPDTFRYPVPPATDAANTWSKSTEEASRRDRFRCRRTTDGAGTTAAAVRYEDTNPVDASSADAYKDLTVGFEAKGLDLEVEGFETTCND